MKVTAKILDALFAEHLKENTPIADLAARDSKGDAEASKAIVDGLTTRLEAHAAKNKPDNPPKEPTAPKAKSEPITMTPEQLQGIVAKAVKTANKSEGERITAIQATGAKLGIENKIVAEAIKDGDTPEQFNTRVIAAMTSANPPILTAKPVESGKPEGDPGTKNHSIATFRAGAITALERRGHPVDELKRSADRYRNAFGDDGLAKGREILGGSKLMVHNSLSGAVTLGDIQRLDAGIGAPVINEVISEAREVAVFPAETINGATVELSVRTGNPTVGFRNANEGTTRKKGTFESKIFQTMPIEEQIAVDIQGVLNASKDPGRVIFNESLSITEAVLEHIGAQTWYGSTAQAEADAKAPPGLYSQYGGAAAYEVDATGSTAKTSCWFVRLGENSLSHIWGNDTTLGMGTDWMEESVDDAAGNSFRALTNYLSGRVAVKLANKNAAV
ncbi:MAG: phage major capsid protein, partial [Solirubrobacterales bacterium]